MTEKESNPKRPVQDQNAKLTAKQVEETFVSSIRDACLEAKAFDVEQTDIVCALLTEVFLVVDRSGKSTITRALGALFVRAHFNEHFDDYCKENDFKLV